MLSFVTKSIYPEIEQNKNTLYKSKTNIREQTKQKTTNKPWQEGLLTVGKTLVKTRVCLELKLNKRGNYGSIRSL